jgi:hypothetical protein
MNTWADLNHLQTGRYGEYFAKMALVRAGFDVFSPEVDDKRIDFVLRIDGTAPRYYDVQVRTVRSKNTYVFVRKDKFRLTANLLLALVILAADSEPEMYLIPASAWRDAKPPFADRDYDGLRSPLSTASRCHHPTWWRSNRSALPERSRPSSADDVVGVDVAHYAGALERRRHAARVRCSSEWIQIRSTHHQSTSLDQPFDLQRLSAVGDLDHSNA